MKAAQEAAKAPAKERKIIFFYKYQSTSFNTGAFFFCFGLFIFKIKIQNLFLRTKLLSN
jgi:hypothetical protein